MNLRVCETILRTEETPIAHLANLPELPPVNRSELGTWSVGVV